MNIITISLLITIFVNASLALKDANDYLRQAGMDVDRRYKEEWIELCSIYLRPNVGFNANSESRTCTVTKDDGILETYVRQNDQFRCSWSYNSYTANTNLNFFERIKAKYQLAISLASLDNNSFAVNILQGAEQTHMIYIQSDKHGATLNAKATTQSWYGSGAKCDLTLMGKIRRLNV